MAKGNSMVTWIAVGALLLYLTVIGNSASGATSSGMVSSDQLQRTIDLESFRPTAYPDGSDSTGQRYSIGYGHQIGTNDSYLLNATITTDDAYQLLQGDFRSIETALNNSGVWLTQGQYDALADFGFSTGITAMNKIINTLVTNGTDAAISELLQYVYWHPVPGGSAVLNNNLVARRNAEISTFNS